MYGTFSRIIRMSSIKSPNIISKKPTHSAPSITNIIKRLHIGDSTVMAISEMGDGFICDKNNKYEFTYMSFPHIETLIAKNWDKNAVYYNINKHVFPNMKNIVLLWSSPCDYNIPWRFKDANWYCTSGFRKYFEGISSYGEIVEKDALAIAETMKNSTIYVAENSYGCDKEYLLKKIERTIHS